MTHLRRLRIGATGLKSLPAALGRLEQLTELGLGGFDGYETLPDALSGLRCLQTLDLTDATGLKKPAGLAGRPARIAGTAPCPGPPAQQCGRHRGGSAASARAVNCRYAVLRLLAAAGLGADPPALPELSETQISVLPEWLAEMQALESLRMEDNPDLQAIPASLGAAAQLAQPLPWRAGRALPSGRTGHPPGWRN